MKTLTTAPTGHIGDPSTRLRRLAAAGALVPLLALGACSGEDAVTANPTGPVEATTSAPSTTTESATGTATPTTATTTTPKPSSTVVNAVIKDPVLGHTITAVKVARNLPWPEGYPIGAESFEIVGVRLKVRAGERYSASVAPSMFALKAAPSTVFVQPTGEFGERYKATPLATTKRGEYEKGWIYFKIDKGATGPLTLRFNRPAYTVSTTDKDIPQKAFDVKLTG